MSQTIYQVDAFTDHLFGGNPAGVCILSKPASDEWMRNVAREMNLSETAFLVKQGNAFNLRWFTPAVEVDLCGHATLGSAHILFEAGYLAPDEQACFNTRSGLLTATKNGDWLEMNFPVKREEHTAAPEGLADALGARPEYVGKNVFDYLVELENEEAVRKLQPDISRLGSLPARGIIVTAPASGATASQGFDFVSRFFAPAVGVPEDPVTGSAHCCLADYWSKKLGKNEMLAYQASARGGVLRVKLDGERVFLGGQAVTVLKGELI